MLQENKQLSPSILEMFNKCEADYKKALNSSIYNCYSSSNYEITKKNNI